LRFSERLNWKIMENGKRPARGERKLLQSARHLWAKTYEGHLQDILAVESDVARSIVNEIEIQLTPAQRLRLASAPPINCEAYELYLNTARPVVVPLQILYPTGNLTAFLRPGSGGESPSIPRLVYSTRLTCFACFASTGGTRLRRCWEA
jgi:hypothetical protein